MLPSIIQIIQTLVPRLVHTYIGILIIWLLVFTFTFLFRLWNKWRHWNIVFLRSPICIFFLFISLYFLQSVIGGELGLLWHNRENTAHLLRVLTILRNLVRKRYLVFYFNHVYAFLPFCWGLHIHRRSSFNLFFILFIHSHYFNSKFEIFKVWVRVYCNIFRLRIGRSTFIDWVWLLFNLIKVILLL